MSSSEDEDDWILRQIQPDRPQKSPKSAIVENSSLSRQLHPTESSPPVPSTSVPSKSSPTASPGSSEPEIDIPDVFLKQGEKNRRLLKQNDEIQLQIQADADKELSRVSQRLKLQQDFLRELNDNGSGYEYSMGADSSFVQELVDSYVRQDPELSLQRHFYFFSAPLPREPASTLPFLGKWTSCTLDTVLSATQKSDLAKIHAYVLETGCGRLDRPFSECMEALGAGSPADCRLKLAHFNDNLSQLTYKVAIVFILALRECSSKADYAELSRYFFLACSDFLLNKHQHGLLCAVLVGPVVNLYVSGATQLTSVQELSREFHNMVQAVGLTVAGPAGASCAGHKLDEMHVGFLESAMASELSADASAFVDALSGCFLGVSELTLTGIAAKVENICTPDFSDPSSIHRGVFQLQLAAVHMQRLVYGATRADGPELVRCRTTFLQSKDSLQTSVGNVCYGKSGSHVEKAQLSQSLSKSFHILGEMSRITDKMAVLLGTNDFYAGDTQSRDSGGT